MPANTRCRSGRYAASAALCTAAAHECATAKVVWRCVIRLDYGTKYCHDSLTLDEAPLQRAILVVINKVMIRKASLIQTLTGALELEFAPVLGEVMRLAKIIRQMEQIDTKTKEILVRSAQEQSCDAHKDRLKALMEETATLKEKRIFFEQQKKENSAAAQHIEDASAAPNRMTSAVTQWDEMLIRQLVDTVCVALAKEIVVTLINGEEIGQSLAL